MSERFEVIPASAIGVEPEEAPARTVDAINVPVNLASLPDVVMKAGRPALDFKASTPVGRMTVPISAETTAGEAANALRARCARCAHFRNDLWRETKRVWAGAPEQSSRRVGLDKMVLQLARTQVDGIPSIKELRIAEAMLGTFGVCSALTEERVDLVLVHPDACCPDGLPYYRDASREAKREASKVFDRIMRMAQGRS